jgi:hypothetical protein
MHQRDQTDHHGQSFSRVVDELIKMQPSGHARDENQIALHHA